MKNRILLTAALITLTTFNTMAQKKWKYEFGTGITQNSGNVENVSVKNICDISRNDSVLSSNVNYKIIYQNEDGEETNKGINGGLKFDLYQYSQWSPFLATEFISNHYKGYDFKISALTGVKYRIFTKKDTCDYSISAAIVYDNVNYTDEVTELNKKLVRISIRPKLKHSFNNTFTIKHTTFYQPKIDEFSDYIIISNTTLENKLSKRLFLDLNFSYEYRSKIPNDDYKKYDICTELTLKLKI